MTRSLIAAKISFVFCLMVLFPVVSASPVYGFQAGANGADGDDGDPGTDGEDGENGTDVTQDSDSGFSLAVGNAGGNGGNGGNGIDGDDADSTAAGGNSGNGGLGGNATANFSRSAYARGGAGGSGGMFGRGSTRSLDGLGGNGGLGGDGHAYVTEASRSSFSEAVGGIGGNAYGQNAFAGDGGGAFVKGMTATSTQQFNGLTAKKFGGKGGKGFIGATGGNGASINFGVDDEFSIGNPADSIFGSIRINGRGGSGGDSENGVAGNAGDASIDMLGISNQLWAERPASRTTFLELNGGFGGRGIATGNQSSSGRDGGNASLTGETVFESLARNDLYINLRGGNGGSALGSRNSGHGGHGGLATIDPISLVNTFSDFTRGFVNATVKGGDGGHGNGSGRAGNGASVDLTNKFTINARAYARMELTANGGDGGWGKGNGNGGHAAIETQNAITQPDELETFTNRVTLRANGGNAGLGVVGEIAAKGGDASAISIEETVNALTVDARALGGIGNLGKSGDANALAHATTTEGGESERFRASANALADSHRIADFDRVLPSIGTSSTSHAMATSHSASQAFARSRAVGGWGFLESGSADSMAHAENAGTGEAIAVSSSFAHGDRSSTTDNFSTSHAHSKTVSGRAESTSVAAGTGHFSRVHATAGIDAGEGFARSDTKSSTISWNHSAIINNNIDFVSTDGTAALVDSSSYFGFRQTGFADTTGVESSVDLLLIPDQSFADSVVAGSGITDVFDADADSLGLGSFGGGFAGDAFDGRLEINSSIDMSLRLQPFHDDKNLILGLFGVESTGDGFEDLSFSVTGMGRSIIDETFTELADATTFFEDHLFNLGELNNEETLIDFQFDFSMNVEDPMDSFKFDFIFGNADPRMTNGPSSFTLGGGNGGLSAVPEPASGILIGLTLLGLVHRRRRS